MKTTRYTKVQYTIPIIGLLGKFHNFDILTIKHFHLCFYLIKITKTLDYIYTTHYIKQITLKLCKNFTTKEMEVHFVMPQSPSIIQYYQFKLFQAVVSNISMFAAITRFIMAR